MMRIIRILSTKKNPCTIQNLLLGSKALCQQAKKMSISSDALKEKLNEENLNGGKEVNGLKEKHDNNKPSDGKFINLNKNMIQASKDFNSSLLYQSKENLLKMVVTLAPSNAVMLMKNLCTNKSRSLDILNALSEKLQSDPPLSLMDCSTVLYCAAVLNFKDLNLIRKMGELIIENKSKFTSQKLPVNIMRSLGVLKYNDQELLEVLLGQILFYKTDTPEDLVTPLVTLAFVNSETPYKKSLIKLLSNYKEVDFSNPEAYLNFVWSCVILNELDSAYISRILSEDFLKKVLGNDKTKTILLKLQNIHGAATCLLKSYNGPILKGNNLLAPAVKKSKSQFLESIKNTLCYISPKEGYLKFNIHTEAGFFIDVECNVNSTGEIVHLKHNDMNKKVAVILLDYHDFCIDEEKITGISAFKDRIVQSKGYTPLMIPYTKFSVSARLSQKIDYLRQHFRSVV